MKLFKLFISKKYYYYYYKCSTEDVLDNIYEDIFYVYIIN